MDLCVDAPLAPLEVDLLSDDSSSRYQTTSREPTQLGRSDGSLLTDQSDMDLLCSGSLTDLVLNFDDRVYHCLDQSAIEQPVLSGTAMVSTVGNIRPPVRDATLSEVKFWWKEAVGEIRNFDYPFGTTPDKLGVYEDFESADADGVTEDENLDLPIIRPYGALDDEVVAEPGTSFQGHVTTDSECSSSFSTRAISPDRAERRSLSPCMERLDETGKAETSPPASSPLTLPAELQTAIDKLSISDQPLQLPTDFTQFTTQHLRAYVDALLAAVLRLSDRLVELLAMRDELVMLREASDDFIILLDLLHQRRARASRAALLATARGRMRPKRFVRLKLPWITRSLFGTPANSLSSLSGLSTAKHGTADRLGANPPKDTESVALNSSSGSVAYYKSLNLQSKQRRPKTQPITINHENGTAPKLNGISVSPPKQQHASPLTEQSSNSLPAATSDRAHERLLALRKVCHTLAWPNGQPQLSKSLTLSLPYDPHLTEGVTLPMLRRLNQILHGALLENVATDKMVTAYIEKIQGRQQVACWIQEVNNHVNSDVHILH